MKARAPVTGGNFGIWGGMFSTFDCAIKGVRQKEDAWNAILSGFMTGGCLAARSESRLLFVLLYSFLTLALPRWTKSCLQLGRCMWDTFGRIRGSWSFDGSSVF